MVAIVEQNQSKQIFRDRVRALAYQIGLRPAARAVGLPEERVMKWAQRHNWQISSIRPPLTRDARLSANVRDPLEVYNEILAQEADRTRSAMARTARRAFEHCDELTNEQLHDMQRAIALEKHGRNASVAHQWNSNQQTVAVQVNVPLPSPEEREEMRSIDTKLDAIAAKLK